VQLHPYNELRFRLYKVTGSELNTWIELHTDGEVGSTKLEYTEQQEASTQLDHSAVHLGMSRASDATEW
jgi:hypothetical protein